MHSDFHEHDEEEAKRLRTHLAEQQDDRLHALETGVFGLRNSYDGVA